MESWRFIDDGEHSGAVNMARDEALALSVSGGGVPALRVYRFKPPAVSIGRFQRLPSGIDLRGCRKLGVEVVRRATGGLALLHFDDFTYSVALPREPRTSTERDRCFSLVAGGIIESLRLLGIEAKLVTHTESGINSSTWCFQAALGVDLQWNGRKICGSAQRFLVRSVLQHGTLFLKKHGDILEKITASGTEIPRNSPPAFTTLEEAAGRSVEWHEVGRAFRSGFSEALRIRLEPARLSLDESSTAERLVKAKYGDESFTLGE